MKTKTANGWTVAKILERIDEKYCGRAASLPNDPNSACFYRTPDGRRCAVGLFIPDGHAGGEFRGNVFGLLDMYPDLQEHMPFGVDGYLDADRSIRKFQAIHDEDALFRQLDIDGQKRKLKQWVVENVEDA